MNNPSIKEKVKSLDKDLIVQRAKELKKTFEMDLSLGYIFIYKTLTKEFPGWSMLFREKIPMSSKDKVPRFRGDNYQNNTLAILLEIRVEDIIKEVAKRRGLKISKGQRASEYCMMKARESGCKSKSTFKTTMPQKRLYRLILKYDTKARMEYTVGAPHFKSFDIYSPKFKVLFEMHGRVWHDLGPKTSISKDLIRKNIENDKYKANVALELKMPLYIFWDDKENDWADSLKQIFSKGSSIKSYASK